MSLLGFISDETFLFIIVMAVPFFMFVFIVIRDKRTASRDLVLYFESDKRAYLLDKKVTDGQIEVGKKRFYIDEEDTPVVEDGMLVKSSRPFHILKWNSSVPLKLISKGLSITSPENLKKLMENKLLEKLLEPKGGEKMTILFLVLGMVVGGVVGFMVAKGFTGA